MSASASTLARHRASSRAPGLRVIRRRSRSLIKRGDARRIAPLYIGAAIVAAAIIAGVLLIQVVLAQSAFQLSTINKKLASAEAQQEQLLAEMAQLESPGRIEHYARDVLGMVDPLQVEYIVARVKFPDQNRMAGALAREDLSLPGEGMAVEAAP
jgi:cell division protein FtsB